MVEIIIADAPMSTLIKYHSIINLVKDHGSMMKVSPGTGIRKRLTFRLRSSLQFWNENRYDLERAGFKPAWINWSQVNWTKKGRIRK